MARPNAELSHAAVRRDLAHVEPLLIPSYEDSGGNTIPARQVDWYRVQVVGGRGQIGPQRGQVRIGDTLHYNGAALVVSHVRQDDGDALTVRAS